jgi:hypothetical protein
VKFFSSERLSPILVKELRQGIRSRLFLGAFLTIQVLLFIYGTSLLMSESLRGESSAALALFWSALILPMVILVPAMASQGIEKEISGKTLDLLLLTRISSYRLVLGKWASVIVQATLLITSALPYLMLRYFLGGIDVWGELQSFGVLILASALLAGITMGFWASKTSKLIKWGGVFVLFWVGPYLLVMLIAAQRGFGGGGMSTGSGLVIWVYAFIAMLMMLALAASRISPPADNHSTQIRVLGLAALVAAFVFRGSNDVEALSAVFAVMILGATVIGALTEKVRTAPRLYAPFVRRHGLARWLAFPLSPGWPGGVAYSAVVLVLAPWFPVWAGEFRIEVFIAVTAVFFFPAALIRTLVRPERRSLGVYLLAQVFLTIPIYVWGAASAFGNAGVETLVEYVVGFFPPVALALAFADPSGYTGTVAAFEGGLVLVWSLIVLSRAARREWTDMVALQDSQPTPATADAAGMARPTTAPVAEGVMS